MVRGRNIPEPIRATPQVVDVLSTADIARAGDGDIASALNRVTGLSVVGSGFVYVRGLGDRYSQALLNGLPLPSPEPLRRAIPLDIFPTSVVASAVVQKSYSANYPGEFGGGVINLTTPTIPKEAFFNIGLGIGVDTVTTGLLGYTYGGSDLDYIGFDDGTRKVPGGIKDAMKNGLPTGSANQAVAASLTNANTTLLQRNNDIPPNFSADLSFGKAFDIGGDSQLGVFGSASFSNTWRTRDIIQQALNAGNDYDGNIGNLRRNARTVITENRAVVSGLFGVGLDIGDNKIRWTNLFIRDTVKQGRLSAVYDTSITSTQPTATPDFYNADGDSTNNPALEQNTFWFERQLIDTQLVGQFRFGDLSVDARGGYANSKRKSPYERLFRYTYNQTAGDYTNNLTGDQTATVAFSNLNEDSYAGGIDIGYKLPTERNIRLTAGYAFTQNDRTSSRYDYRYLGPSGSALPTAVAQERPDYLVSDYNVYTYGITLQDQSASTVGAAQYDAKLRVHAGYGQVDFDIVDGLKATAGVRFEKGLQRVLLTGQLSAGIDPLSEIKKDYWLPAGTITWNFADNLQLRASGSKTIGRPQFRELAYQIFRDFESDRTFQGNPFLRNTRFTNAEARLEYYPHRGEIIAIDGFYKDIKNPVEQVAFFAGEGLRTGFANAPKAQLYGGEAELTKFFDLDTLGPTFFTTRRLRISANYTYTHSKLQIGDEQVVNPNDLQTVAASQVFRDGAPLTGQSDHLANLQIGFEDQDHLSQQTLLLTYASPRVTNRGPTSGTTPQPDIYEKPGVTLDFVLREEQPFYSLPIEFKIEARNLLGRKFQEYQKINGYKVYINRYDLGRVVSLSATAKF